ncbi:hypothetical protein [Cupriavidus sp. AU9028]|uniref:hypothetical protein n=1 Tax=Cupriavidus sp. AU9028 TaxID=2871157 RepID=UPI001C94EB4B|nr:hypothetical protein [Cupriavidus sp. AU9028]MBY4898708.1 hypothetical protein [Cupriavidus sp. AU9028]
MLSLDHPEVCQTALQHPLGIHSIRIHGEGVPRLLLKLPVSYLLPIKLGHGFRIYVVPVDVADVASYGLMCAFDDDDDEPLVCWRMLDDHPDTHDLLHALTRREVFVHLFDEQNRELAGYRAITDVPLEAKARLDHLKFPRIDHAGYHAATEEAKAWFGRRNPTDDAGAMRVKFVSPLFPDDQLIEDDRDHLYRFHGAKGRGFTTLERVEAGLPQELDIILLLQRVFRPDQIFHAPLRHYDNEEIADVVVLTDDVCLVIQAKDSPNTSQTLQRSIERKRTTTRKQLRSAINQVVGALSYIKRTRPLRMRVDGEEVVVDLGQRNILALVVVRELFLDDYDAYSALLFNALGRGEHPCLALEYEELHSYTTFCPSPAQFLSAYFQVFDSAMEHGEFPRLRFGLNDVEALLQAQEKTSGTE